MNKIGICGHLANGKDITDGQTIKTRNILIELKKKFGEDCIVEIDTFEWKKNPIKLFLSCIDIAKKCSHIIILPAHNGIRIFIPLFIFLQNIFRYKLHYVVIGGWLKDYLKNRQLLKSLVRKVDYVYVETKTLLKELNTLNIDNTVYLPNFKNICIIDKKYIKMNIEYSPYKLCIFSRVMEEKGISDIIESILIINNRFNKNMFTLDIFGPIEKKYQEKFSRLLEENNSFVKYNGIADSQESSLILKEFFMLVFPTKFATEGIPGTIIDAYAAGIPILASRWNSWSDIIDENKTGITYELNNKIDLEKKLLWILNNKDIIVNMKENCLKKAENFTSDVCLENLYTRLNYKYPNSLNDENGMII